MRLISQFSHPAVTLEQFTFPIFRLRYGSPAETSVARDQAEAWRQAVVRKGPARKAHCPFEFTSRRPRLRRTGRHGLDKSAPSRPPTPPKPFSPPTKNRQNGERPRRACRPVSDPPKNPTATPTKALFPTPKHQHQPSLPSIQYRTIPN